MASDKESLKVLIISSEHPPEGVGGLGTLVFELTGGLSRANCDVTVFRTLQLRYQDLSQNPISLFMVGSEEPYFLPQNTPGYSLEFKMDESGFIREALLSQSNGISTLKHIQSGM